MPLATAPRGSRRARRTAPPTDRLSRLDTLLDRPADQRRREYQYRFAQSAVFGLPVLALQWFGPSLGGPEADRWVALLQALLAGWVLYVGVAGMLFESVLRLGRRQFSADLLPSVAAVALFAIGLWRAVPLLAGETRPTLGSTFHWSVLIPMIWTGLRCFLAAREPEALSTLSTRRSGGSGRSTGGSSPA